MIVLLTSRYISGNKKDVEALRRILTALGVESGSSPQDHKQSRSATSASFLPAISIFQLIFSSGGSGLTDISIQVSEPLLALQIVKQSGFRIVEGLSDEEVACAGFRIKLPSGASVHVGALPADTDSALPALSGSLSAAGKRFGIVVARFNAFITERLLQGAFDGLVRSGALRKDITIVRVPGAFEIPSAARTLAETEKCDAILCVGCLLRGDTAHYDVIVNEVTRGIGQSAQETGVPHAFGVLTCDTLEQAIDRAGLKMGNKGLEAATAAIEMANLQQVIRGHEGSRPAGKVIKKNSPKMPIRKPVAALRRQKK